MANKIINLKSCTQQQLWDLRAGRWKARTDLGWLCRNVLGFEHVTDNSSFPNKLADGPDIALHQPIIDTLQKFPHPTEEQFYKNDTVVGDTWVYKPIMPLEKLEGKRRVLILDPRGFLKCARKSVRINHLQKGLVRADEIQVGDVIWGFNTETNRPEPTVVEEVEPQPPQPCYRIRLRSGRTVEVSHEHPFRTVTDWVQAKDLKPGDRIGVLGIVPEPEGAPYLPESEIVGWFLGDGCIGGQTVSNINPLFQKRIIAAVRRAGGTAYTTELRDDGQYSTVRCQHLRPMFRKYGLMGPETGDYSRSGDKFIPPAFFAASNQSVKELLYALYMSDGTCTKKGISLTSKSLRLVEDVQFLLQRFGIWSTINPVRVKYKDAYLTFHTLDITSEPEVRKFLDAIGWDKGMRFNLNVTTNPNTNTVPKEWRKMYGKYLWSRGEKPSGLPVNKSFVKYDISKSKLRKFADALGDEKLRNLCDDAIRWDFVTEVEHIGDEETMAIQTSNQTLCLESVFSHNTTINVVGHTIQWIINYPDIAIMIIQSTGDKANDFLNKIKMQFQGNERFRRLFPEHCPQTRIMDWGRADRFVTEARSKSVMRSEPTVMATSIDKGASGIHVDVMKFSDIVDPNNISGNGLQLVKDAFYMMQNLLVAPRYWIDVEGTRYHNGDLYGEIINHELELPPEKRFYKIHARPVFKQVLPPTYDGSHPPEYLDFDRYPFELDANGKRIPLWPRRFDLEYLEDMEKRDLYTFATQQLNNPSAGMTGGKPFSLVNGHLPSANIISRTNFIQRVPIAYKEISVDCAYTTGKRSDYTALVVGAFDHYGRCYVEEVMHGKWLPDEINDRIVAMILKHYGHLKCVKIEKAAYTAGMMTGLRRLLDTRNIHVTFNLIPRETDTSKTDRILKTLQPWYKAGDVRWLDDIPPDTMKALLKELDTFPGLHEDILDATSDLFQDKNWFGREIPNPVTLQEKRHYLASQTKEVMTREFNRMIGLEVPYDPLFDGDQPAQSSGLLPKIGAL